MYGVPSRLPTATRQWDLVASAGIPTTGPTASATYNCWSFLQAVNTLSPVSVLKFSQNKDTVNNQMKYGFVFDAAPTSFMATYKVAALSMIPFGANDATIGLRAAVDGGVSNIGGKILGQEQQEDMQGS
jgi:hypothetical protein